MEMISSLIYYAFIFIVVWSVLSVGVLVYTSQFKREVTPRWLEILQQISQPPLTVMWVIIVWVDSKKKR